MPVYEIVLREPSVPHKVSFRNRPVTLLGDRVIIDDQHWIVVEKEPPFELRRIERLICERAALTLRDDPAEVSRSTSPFPAADTDHSVRLATDQ